MGVHIWYNLQCLIISHLYSLKNCFEILSLHIRRENKQQRQIILIINFDILLAHIITIPNHNI